MAYRYFPFNFRKLASNKYILTNDTNTFSFIKNREELESIINYKFNFIEDKKIDELLSKNFLYSDDEFELKKEIFVTNIATKTYSSFEKPSLFLIVPTLRCDLDCSYCQVSRVSQSKKGFDLSKSYIKEIIRVIDKVSDKSFKIEFQGGEPLLYFDFIKTFVKEISSRIKDKNISFVICTNLNNINAEILEFCRENTIYISTSLDGDESVHNKNRSSKNINSYSTFKEKLELTRTYLADEVSALSTITKKTMKDYKKFVNSYIENDFKSISIRPLTQLGFAYKENSYSAEEFFQFYKKCLEYIFEINKDTVFIEENLLVYLSKIFTPFKNSYLDLQSPSAYILNSLVFNYNGKIFGSDEARMLWEMTKLDFLELGDIKTKSYNFLQQENVTILSNSFIDHMPMCEECTYKNYCGVDVFHHLSMQNDIVGDKSISFFCKLNKLIFDYIFESIDTDKEKKDIFFKWLNH